MQIPTEAIRMQAAIPRPSGNKGLAEQISCHISVTNSNTHRQGHCEDRLSFRLPDSVYGSQALGASTPTAESTKETGNFIGFLTKLRWLRIFGLLMDI